MKKLTLLCAAIPFACIVAAQPSFQTTLEAGISLPLNSNNVNATHAGRAIHFGNHLDYSFGNGAVRFGLGAYIGYINSISTDNKYKEIGEAIAEKYRFTSSQLTFNSAPFKSTHILLGPVASFGSGKCNINVWAKGGYGLNEPSRYAVLDKENGVTNNVYVNQAGENKNGLAYSLGAGIRYALSEYVGLQLSAGYFTTQTDQVNYNFDREKGITPLYTTASNQFIQASAGLQFTIGNPDKKIKTGKGYRYTVGDTSDPVAMHQKMKTKSNIKNDRLANTAGNTGDDNPDNDSLFFSPQKIELRSKITAAGTGRTQLQAVDNYLTGFVYQTPQGNVLSQCGSNAMPGDPVPGIDVRLRRAGAAAGDAMAVRTNRDGSFAFNNITPGNYSAEAGSATMDITVNGDKQNDFKILDIDGGSCSSTKENYIITADDKTYVEVISAGSSAATAKKHIANVKYNDFKAFAPRDAATGLATGKRMHKPFLVADMEFDVNMDDIVTNDGKLYAEVITAREASSGMATGRTIVTGDVDGDGLTDYTIVSPRDPASGMPTGKRMHKPFVITKELDFTGDAADIVSPRDPASGMATGKRMHKPFVITKELDFTGDAEDIVSPRDPASGMPTGKRMHKPFVITKELDFTGDADDIVSPRDAASGLPTGKRMHKPFVITVELDNNNEIVSPRDAASGLPTGKRMHKPYVISIDQDADSYEVISPRDAASGQSSGKRMHKPFVITKELGFNEDGNEVAVYKIIHRDLAARNVLVDEENDTQKMAIKENGISRNNEHKKGIITGKDNDNGMYTETDDAAEAIVSNPLYTGSGTSGQNPLFESRDALHVTGGDGKGHDIFIPSDLQVKPGNEAGIAAYSTYELGPVKWMAPESLNKRTTAGKGISEKGVKKNEAASRKGWDGTVKGSSKNINTSEDNLGSGKATEAITANDPAGKGISEKGIKKNEASSRKGWDGTVKGGAIVKDISRVHCMDGSCAIEATVEVDGVAYEALITGVMTRK